MPLSGLAEIRTPRAVVWGADDTVDSVASGRATAAALGVPLQLISGAGHLTLLSRPQAVAQRVLGVLAPVPPEGRRLLRDPLGLLTLRRGRHYLAALRAARPLNVRSRPS